MQQGGTRQVRVGRRQVVAGNRETMAGNWRGRRSLCGWLSLAAEIAERCEK